MPIHVTDLNDHRNLTLEDFGRLIAGRPRARLGDLTLQEICQVPLRPHGIYFMYATDGALWYIGKASSRTFGTRMSAHLDQQEGAMLNTVPRKIVKHRSIPYQQALSQALDLQVTFISVPEEIGMDKLEAALQSVLRPHLNTRVRKVLPSDVVATFMLSPVVRKKKARTNPRAE